MYVGMIEFLWSRKDILSQRKFSSGTHTIRRILEQRNIENLDSGVLSDDFRHGSHKDEFSSAEPSRVCIWASNVMDGQKNIWLNQIEYMDSRLFRFIWTLHKTLEAENLSGDNSSLTGPPCPNPNPYIINSYYLP